MAQAPALSPAWLKAAFVFLLVGFGTKMGLAPMHTWKPDTYGEAPPLVGGLMAGALTSCAFLGIARIVQVTTAAGLAEFVRPLLIGFGLLSLLVPRCSWWRRMTSSGCWPIPASSTWACWCWASASAEWAPTGRCCT